MPVWQLYTRKSTKIVVAKSSENVHLTTIFSEKVQYSCQSVLEMNRSNNYVAFN